MQFGDSLPILDFGTGFVPEHMGLGQYHSCFVSTNGSVVCFGENDRGQVQVLIVSLAFHCSRISCFLCIISSVTEMLNNEEFAVHLLKISIVYRQLNSGQNSVSHKL